LKYNADALVDRALTWHSSGVLKPRRFLGRELRLAAIASQSSCVTCAMLGRLGRYRRTSPFVFSPVPRFQEWSAAAK
jgi:hypothetical protein